MIRNAMTTHGNDGNDGNGGNGGNDDNHATSLFTLSVQISNYSSHREVLDFGVGIDTVILYP